MVRQSRRRSVVNLTMVHVFPTSKFAREVLFYKKTDYYAKIGYYSNEATRESFVVFVTAKSGFSLLGKGELDTFSFRQADSWGLAISDDEDVANSGREGVTLGVLDVSDIVSTKMSLDGLENTDSSNVVSSGEGNSASVHELDNAVNLVGGEVELKKAR